MTQSGYFNLRDYFLSRERLAAIGHRTAIKFRGRSLTYNDLATETGYWVRCLESNAVKQGDAVALLLYDSPEFIAVFLASAAIGAIAVPINTFLDADSISYILRDSNAGVLIAERDLESKVCARGRLSESKPIPVVWVDPEERPSLADKSPTCNDSRLVSTNRDTSAFMLYTSGSTGEPKGVLHRHGAVPSTVETYVREVLRLTPKDLVYSASRMFFAYGLGNSLSFPLSAGAASILHTERATPEAVAGVIAQDRPTVFFGVPTLYRSLLELKTGGEILDTSSLRLCISAGEALPGKIFEDWRRATGLEILDGIGSTEMLHIFLSNRPGSAAPDSSGSVVNGYEAGLTDDFGNVLESDQTGNLWVRGESAFMEYWGRPDLTAEVKRGGWVRTGDIYHRTADGRFYHVGCSDDCFKVKGMWVSPVEVESALLTHDSVIEAAVVADYDDTGLATGRAYVVIREGVETAGLEAVLRDHINSRIAHHKVPDKIEFLDRLPRTATGKVQRFRLRRDRKASNG